MRGKNMKPRMALSSVPNSPTWKGFTVVFLLLALRFAPTKSETDLANEHSEISQPEMEEAQKSVLGSRPPACINKCLSCRPCMATLVIPSHRERNFMPSLNVDDSTYYLLMWKCRCGNKLFQP